MTNDAKRIEGRGGGARRAGLGVAFVVGLALAGAAVTSLSGDADAQPPKSRKGKPAKAAASASAAASVAVAPPAGSVAVVASAGPVAPPRDLAQDGGVRASPLNPNADEMPGYVAPGASAPAPVPTIDYDKLLGDIAALRARIADVSDALFVSRIALRVETDGEHAKVGHLTVELDDGVVYTAAPNFHAPDPVTIYEHAVAPGHHAITVDVDRKDDRDDTFRDSQKSRFIVDVPKDQRLDVALRVGDDSDMGGRFPGDRRGTYDVRVRMKAVASPVKR